MEDFYKEFSDLMKDMDKDMKDALDFHRQLLDEIKKLNKEIETLQRSGEYCFIKSVLLLKLCLSIFTKIVSFFSVNPCPNFGLIWHLEFFNK